MPENIYYWRTRFHDDKNWGVWSDGSDYFKIGGLKDIIENGAWLASETILDVNSSEAASALEKAAVFQAAEALVDAWTKNSDKVLKILLEMNTESLANLLAEISSSPSSPSDAAEILESITVERAVQTVQAMIKEEKYDSFLN